MNDDSREEKKLADQASKEPLMPKPQLLRPEDPQDIVVEMAPEVAVQKKDKFKESFSQ